MDCSTVSASHVRAPHVGGALEAAQRAGAVQSGAGDL